jgi:hypothetical protein
MSRPIARLLFAVFGASAVLAAFLRGNYLLGLECGAMYAVASVALLWLLARARTPAGKVSTARAAFVTALILPVGYVMAFPASINPDMQVFIDKQATDRQARAELTAVFASDPAYRDLSMSSVHLKVVNITIRGSLGARSELDRLRLRLATECPTVGNCPLHWAVTLRDTGQKVDGLDRDLFQEAAPGAEPDGGGM